MSDLIATGIDWLNRELKAHASKAVVYSRGADSVPVDATLGQTVFRFEDPGTGQIRRELSDRDIGLDAAQLILGGSVTLPRRGDRFRVAVGSTTEVYEVLAPNGEQPYKLDPHGVRLTVHGKLIDVE